MTTEPIRSLREELPLQAEWVRRLARRLVRDEAAAEDLAQEAALASLRARNPLQGALRPWLGRVASNLAQRGWRDAETRRRGEREAARPEALPGPVEVLSRLEIQGQLVEELKQLEEPLRSVVVRHFFDGWSLVRIARESGVPPSTVSGQLQRALAELRTRLDRRESRDGIRWRPALVALAAPRFPWLAPHGPAATVLGPLQGALAMKLTTQIALVGVVLATGLGVYLATDTEAPEVAAEAAVAIAPESRDDELPASESPELELEQPASREALAATTPAPAKAAPAPAPELRRRVDGRCVDRALVPIAGARALSVEEPGARSEPTGGDGLFTLTCAPAGDGSRAFRVEAEGFGTRFVSAVVDPEDTTHLGDVVLEPGGRVRGRVLLATGAACAGAEVRVTGTNLWESLEAARRHGPSTYEPALTTTSARDGSFVIAGVAAGLVRVWASAPGLLHAVTQPIEVPAGGEPAEVVLTLEPPERIDRITGFVVGPDDQPVAHARFRVTCSLPTGADRISGAEADGAGRFDFPAPPGAVFDFTVRDPEERWVPLTTLRRSAAEGEIELRFVETPWIEVVARSDGKPVTDYALVAGAEDDDAEPGPRSEHPGGRARVHAPLGAFSVELDAPGYELARRGPFEAATVPGLLEFELVPGPGLRGRVTLYGRPLPGARVTLHDANPRLSIDHDGYPSFLLPAALDQTQSDGEGRFVLRARASGEFVVRAESEDLAAADAGPFAFEPRRGRDDLELALTRGGVIEGRVLMPTGREASGVIVAVNRGDAHARTLRSGEDGRFRFEGLTPGPWHVARGKLEITPEESGTAYNDNGRVEIPFNCEVVDGETTQCNVDLRDWEPCLLHGELLANGAPLANWELMVWPTGRTAIVGDLPTTTTDAEGRFRVPVEEAGPMRLDFLPPRDGASGGRLSIEVVLRAGDNPWRADLAVGRLSGTIAGAQPGERDRYVYESREGEAVACSLPIAVGADGSFTLPFVPAGHGAIRRMQGRGIELETVTLAEVEVAARATREVHVR